MALAGLEGKIDEYVALKAYGLNALEVDVKDETEKIGFVSAAMPKWSARSAPRSPTTTWQGRPHVCTRPACT